MKKVQIRSANIDIPDYHALVFFGPQAFTSSGKRGATLFPLKTIRYVYSSLIKVS